jgi:hypothetical protein
MRTKPLAGAAVLAAALALAACGGGGGGSSSSSTSEASVATFCAKARQLQQLGSTFGNLSVNDLAGARTAFAKADQKLKEIDDAAPPAVKSSADKVFSVFNDINSAVQNANSPQDLQRSAQSFAPELGGLQSALNDLKGYGRQHCKT